MRSPVLTVAPNGVALAYREYAASRESAGSAARSVPVLLVHGMGGDGRTWTRFAGNLVKAGRRVIIVDLRGHGRSGRAPSYRFAEFAADVAGLCAHLGVEAVDLVGHSLGGHVGSLVAQQNPGLVRRLVLEETPLPLREGDPVPEVPAHRPTPAELWHAATSMALNPRAVTAFDRSMTPSVVAQFHTPNPVWWKHLPSLDAPTLLLRGARRGSMVDPRLLAAAVDALPSASVREIGCGHSIHRDRARDFAAAVVPFLTDRTVA
ncbi:alpha/beta fold hydrolase [Rhodococcus pyridinivorans]|uniref:alpha/beta fold hydrolase n=1 Tax=Rhodococcus pyridinivorans TaxID=103816 RepID=UPI001907AB88|nr:alpha/beta hydrolase [Rhodococcus pyridinivorans]QQM52062.1 alpha/beta hydrolase [Rhodococcus pyridinivorans]